MLEPSTEPPVDVPPITERLATKCRRDVTLVRAILLGALWTASIPAAPLQAQGTQEEETGGANQDQDEQARLAKQTQNPISNLISLPAQNNTSFGIGEFDRTSNVLNIQPVIPVKLSSSINLISRAILSIISAPDVTRPEGTTWGLGDLTYTAFFSPAEPGALIWGAGPVLLFPTGTSDETGAGKWGAGPSIVLLGMPGKMVLGVLVSNIWSYAGDSDRADVNLMLIQYFINYNLPNAWYLSNAPIITSDWTKPASAKAPTFAVWALKDPESGNLDRVQIIKGWYQNGYPQEKIYDLGWSDNRQPDATTGKLPPVGNTVDIKNATYTNSIGDSQLSVVWTDPDFDPSLHAVYYVRVLEIPTPRWSTGRPWSRTQRS